MLEPRMLPAQGEWSVTDYLELNTNQLIEYVGGRLVFLPMPTRAHQFIARYVFRLLDEDVRFAKPGQCPICSLPGARAAWKIP